MLMANISRCCHAVSRLTKDGCPSLIGYSSMPALRRPPRRMSLWPTVVSICWVSASNCCRFRWSLSSRLSRTASISTAASRSFRSKPNRIGSRRDLYLLRREIDIYPRHGNHELPVSVLRSASSSASTVRRRLRSAANSAL